MPCAKYGLLFVITTMFHDNEYCNGCFDKHIYDNFEIDMSHDSDGIGAILWLKKHVLITTAHLA